VYVINNRCNISSSLAIGVHSEYRWRTDSHTDSNRSDRLYI
jgi:hypothetical protein